MKLLNEPARGKAPAARKDAQWKRRVSESAALSGLDLVVRNVVRETAESCSIELEAADVADRERLDYRPGQFLTLRIPHAEGALARCYSISSSPFSDEALKVTVKRSVGGRASNWLCDNAREGMRLRSLPPSGLFTPKSLEDDLLLIAGGSGITPIMSILKSALLRGRGRLVLVHVDRDQSSAIFADEIGALERGHTGRLIVVHWRSDASGRLDISTLRELTAACSNYDAFICGPAGLNELAQAALQANGTEFSRIHLEVYNSLSGDPFLQMGAEVASAAAGAIEVEVDFYGDTRRLFWPSNVVLLELLLRNNIDAPHSCREGGCGTCMCQTTEGRVRMIDNNVLGVRETQAGYILACQALPDGVDVKVTFGFA